MVQDHVHLRKTIDSSFDVKATYPPAAADPDHEKVRTPSSALNLPLCLEGTLSMSRLRISGRVQLAKDVLTTCSTASGTLADTGLAKAITVSSRMSMLRVTNVTRMRPTLQPATSLSYDST